MANQRYRKILRDEMKSTCREPIETTLSKSCFREDRIDPAGLIRQ